MSEIMPGAARDDLPEVPVRWTIALGWGMAALILGGVLSQLPHLLIGLGLLSFALLEGWGGGRRFPWSVLISLTTWAACSPSVLSTWEYWACGSWSFAAAVLAARVRRRYLLEHHGARLDSLTGIGNRRALEERLQAELSRSQRFGRPVSLIVLDGDHFKQINDLHGHPAGDQALRAIGQGLTSCLRQYDFVARMGGDEFAVILPETSLDQARSIVQRIQQTFEHHPVLSPYRLTCCYGAATFTPGEWQGETCLAEADRQLLLAKQDGPNHARFHELSAEVPAAMSPHP